jgi:hypothetical protein
MPSSSSHNFTMNSVPHCARQALWGINLNLAMTGQEEVQYKVFIQLGL